MSTCASIVPHSRRTARVIRAAIAVVMVLPLASVSRAASSVPYLRSTGPVDIRFQKKVAFNAKPVTKTVSLEVQEKSTMTQPDIILPNSSQTPSPDSNAGSSSTSESETKIGPAESTLRPILPDALAPQLSPEDVLPYFMMPATPPERMKSTATYTQK